MKADLSRRLRAIGYIPDPNGIATAFASFDPVKETMQHYNGYKPIPYYRQPARLKLVRDGKVLWNEAWASDPPEFTFLPNKTNITEFVQGYGSPQWSIYSKAAIPAMFVGPNHLIFAFGSSELHPETIKDRR